jgi:cell wall-associated NlpC family hydrolase
LVGREYAYGVLDCLSIVYDYYLKVLGITLPKRDKDDFAWYKEQNLIVARYKDYGFEQVCEPILHDVIVMYNGSEIPNHFGVYLGNGKMLHHVQGRLSSRDAYGNGGIWDKNTWGYLRHLDLM